MIKGSPRFNAIAIGELSANFTGSTIHLEGTAGFVDTETGETHGWTKGDGKVWSRTTMLKLAELREFMERDLSKLHFTDSSVENLGATEKLGLNLGGIAEHAKGEKVDAPSV